MDKTPAAAGDVRDKVDWSKQWYAAYPVEYLDPSRPNGFQVLGKHLVLWKDKEGKWSCMEDKCPHR
jgi:phenylpropionate dioxygenase-like ring-hydroxylating dioxygenase large terminal subunit